MRNTVSGQASLISVVIPCYNAAPFVAETIESVLAQTYPHVEVIVVDDASTDGSWEVIRSYGERVTAVRQEANGGGCRARNGGAEIARGEYLMFLDADDTIGPETLEALVDALRDQPNRIAVCRWRRLVRVDGQWTKQPAEVALPSLDGDTLHEWLMGRYVPPCGVLWPRGVYSATGGWDESVRKNQDGDIMMRALADGARLALAERGEAYYRSHGDERLSVSTDIFSEGQLRSRIRVLERLEVKLQRQGRLETYADALGTAYIQLAREGLPLYPALGRECLQRSERYVVSAPPEALLARTLPGRLLSLVLGVETKESVARLLVRFGIMTRARRHLIRAQGQLAYGSSDQGREQSRQEQAVSSKLG